MIAKAEKYPTYNGWDAIAERYLKLGHYSGAAAAFRREAAMYRAAGMEDAAAIKEKRASLYETDIKLFLERKPTKAERKALNTGALLEPPAGAYVGAFIDRDDNLKRIFQGDNWQWHRYPEDFARITGKRHATYFMYLNYKNNFPGKWMSLCKRQKVIPTIAWEPDNLNQVQDNQHLRQFAKALRKFNWPVFIRFASEMNGSWTPYHGNPGLYREKFRLVHRVLHQYAPKVATIWDVDYIPGDDPGAYYPGDKFCDWVGVNIYSVPYLDNALSRPAFGDSPLEQLDKFYKKYAARKPIAVCEFGVSHMATADNKTRTSFATEKMSLMYGALPLLYPRVKMICVYDSNNIKHASPGRQLNNFNITGTSLLLDTYHNLVEPPYFIGALPRKHQLPARLPFPLKEGQRLPAKAQVDIWVKTYTSRPSVILQVGNKTIYAAHCDGAHHVVVDISKLSRGKNKITVYVYDNKNRFIAKQIRVVRK